MKKRGLRVAGLMSGTSADGVSVAIADIGRGRLRLPAFRTFGYPRELRRRSKPVNVEDGLYHPNGSIEADPDSQRYHIKGYSP